MIIGIDARPLNGSNNEIETYINTLLVNILNNDANNEYVFFSDKEIVFDVYEYKNVKFVLDTSKYILKNTIWYNIKLPRLLREYNIDVFWGTQQLIPMFINKKISNILTIHDEINKEFLKNISWLQKRILHNSVNKADKIILKSNLDKVQFREYFSKFDIENKVVLIDSAKGKDYSNIREEKVEVCWNKYALKYISVFSQLGIVKICMIIGSYPPEKCGVGDYTQLLCENIIYNKKDVEIHIITSNPVDGVERKYHNRIKIHSIVDFWKFKDYKEISKAVKKIKPKIIHIQYPSDRYGNSFFINLLPLMLKVSCRAVIVETVHEYVGYSNKNKLRNLINYKASDEIIVVENRFCDEIKKFAKLFSKV